MRLVALLLWVAGILAASSGIDRYIHADYEGAIPLLRAEAKSAPDDDRVAAALLGSLVARNLYAEALTLNERVAAQFPKSAVAVAARGDFEFLRGRMGEAERLYRAALDIDERTARAYTGLYQVMRAHSRFNSARLMALRAHQILPEDTEVRLAWIAVAPEEKKIELMSTLEAEKPKWDERRLRRFHADLEVRKALAGRKPNARVGPPTPAMIQLVRIERAVYRTPDWGVRFTVNGNVTLSLAVSSNVRGVLIDGRKAARAGVRVVADWDFVGSPGDQRRKTSVAIADSCTVAPVEFRNCVVRVGAENLEPGNDGWISTECFRDFLVRFSPRDKALQLTPLPEQPENPQGYDRALTPGFVPVVQSEGILLLPVRLDDGEPGLFEIGTGSHSTMVDRTFAMETGKPKLAKAARGGNPADNVQEIIKVDRATLRFAGFRPESPILEMFHLHAPNDTVRIRNAGVLGMDVLDPFDITFDYRNGQVKLDHRPKR